VEVYACRINRSASLSRPILFILTQELPAQKKLRFRGADLKGIN
jgi:hypothetical protein